MAAASFLRSQANIRLTFPLLNFFKRRAFRAILQPFLLVSLLRRQRKAPHPTVKTSFTNIHSLADAVLVGKISPAFVNADIIFQRDPRFLPELNLFSTAITKFFHLLPPKLAARCACECHAPSIIINLPIRVQRKLLAEYEAFV